MSIGQDLLNVPMGEMIYSMASAIARSQLELDHASIESAEMMGGLKTVTDDQGNVTFTDSRVFFGHEYMTVAQAMVLEADGNPAVQALVGAATLSYDTYNAPTSPGPETTISTTAVPNKALSATSLADYQQSTEVIKTRIAFLQTEMAAKVEAGAAQTTIDKYKEAIAQLKELLRTNQVAVSSVFERQIRVPTRLSLLELGFAPVFYSFVDTIIEVKIAISITRESASTTTTENTGRSVQGSVAFRGIPFLRAKMNRTREVATSQVNASYSSRYSYTAEGSSLLRTKLTPVPTPAVLEDRIRQMMDDDRQRKAAQLALLTQAADPVGGVN